MRHKVRGRKLGRERDYRRLLLKNLVKSLVLHGRINTTLAKAKELRRVAERLVTYGKKGTVHHRRLAYRYLNDRTLVKKLFDEIAPRYKNINGGYTRIIKNGHRLGDNAPMAIIEYIEGIETKSKDTIKTADLTKE